jgi:hypothetical protein
VNPSGDADTINLMFEGLGALGVSTEQDLEGLDDTNKSADASARLAVVNLSDHCSLDNDDLLAIRILSRVFVSLRKKALPLPQEPAPPSPAARSAASASEESEKTRATIYHAEAYSRLSSITGIDLPLEMKMPPIALWRLKNSVLEDGHFPAGWGNFELATSVVDVPKKTETHLGGQVTLTSITDAKAEVDLTKPVSVLRATSRLLYNLLAVGCVQTPLEGPGSLGDGGGIRDSAGTLHHHHFTITVLVEVYNWMMEVCMHSPTSAAHYWSVLTQRASHLMSRNFCAAHALVTASTELNPRLLFSVQAPVLPSPIGQDSGRQGTKRGADGDTKSYCREFQGTGRCTNRNCVYVHECKRCGSKKHGDQANFCPRR